MNKIVFWLSFVLPLCGAALAQKKGGPVSPATMQAIYNEVKTEHKYGLVIVPKNDSEKVDCPTVFRRGSKWYMSYIVFNGRGYQTWMAESDDLLSWTTLACALPFENDSTKWDANQKAGYAALVETKWGGGYALQRYRGNYWMSYFGGRERGYETGLLSLGMAYTDGDPTKASWQHLQRPVLTSLDNDVRWWENKKQFKSTVIRDKNKTTGFPFVMYYNANGDTAVDNKRTRWFERIGMAVSNDMQHWKRFGHEPVVHHPVGITGDPWIQKIGDVWVMFYFGAFWQDRQGAFNRFACSYDLVNWTDWSGDNLIESSTPYDAQFAHKSCVLKWGGIVYHFYNAVNKKGQRGIALATSKDLGKSVLQFADK